MTVDIVSDVAPESMLEAPVHKSVMLSAEVLPSHTEGFVLLGYIDPDDDTYFNRWQMTPFLEEWDRLQPHLHLPNHIRVWKEIRDLAVHVQERSDGGLYLRFSGE